jgi:hypothetical protein
MLFKLKVDTIYDHIRTCAFAYIEIGGNTALVQQFLVGESEKNVEFMQEIKDNSLDNINVKALIPELSQGIPVYVQKEFPQPSKPTAPKRISNKPTIAEVKAKQRAAAKKGQFIATTDLSLLNVETPNTESN